MKENHLQQFFQSFFRRSVQRNLMYNCFNGGTGVQCTIRLVKGGTSPCPACRMKRCVDLNMSLTGDARALLILRSLEF